MIQGWLVTRCFEFLSDLTVSEAYPSGELKHGHLALVDSEMPVVVATPKDALMKKLKSNIQ